MSLTSKIGLGIAAVALLVAIFFAQAALPARSPSAAAIDPNKYYAVLLNNNSVYFGRLQGLGSPFPVLTEVYYIQSNQNPDTKAVSNVLVKRGKELHGPDRMVINEKSIVFVEPVGPDSKVAELIRESKR
jgi:hypothetical protein